VSEVEVEDADGERRRWRERCRRWREHIWDNCMGNSRVMGERESTDGLVFILLKRINNDSQSEVLLIDWVTF
jgi:hypothetical protein